MTEPVDYARLHNVMHLLPHDLKRCSAEVRNWALDTVCPVPGKDPMRLGDMTVDDHKAISRYLKAHRGRYPGEPQPGRPLATIGPRSPARVPLTCDNCA